jgi:hypothetical protein
MDIKTLNELYNLITEKFYSLTDKIIDENDSLVVAADQGERKAYFDICDIITQEILIADSPCDKRCNICGSDTRLVCVDQGNGKKSFWLECKKCESCTNEYLTENLLRAALIENRPKAWFPNEIN